MWYTTKYALVPDVRHCCPGQLYPGGCDGVVAHDNGVVHGCCTTQAHSSHTSITANENVVVATDITETSTRTQECVVDTNSVASSRIAANECVATATGVGTACSETYKRVAAARDVASSSNVANERVVVASGVS